MQNDMLFNRMPLCNLHELFCYLFLCQRYCQWSLAHSTYAPIILCMFIFQVSSQCRCSNNLQCSHRDCRLNWCLPFEPTKGKSYFTCNNWWLKTFVPPLLLFSQSILNLILFFNSLVMKIQGAKKKNQHLDKLKRWKIHSVKNQSLLL